MEVLDKLRHDPRVSVGLPVFNGEEHLEKGLRSLLSQDLDDFELIISDNASSDSTPEICADYVRQDRRIRYVRNEKNIGAARNFSRLVDLASGEYFKWAAHDDWWEPQFLRSCVEVLDREPSSVLCSTGVTLVDREGRSHGVWHPVSDLSPSKPQARFHRLIWAQEPPHMLYGVIRTAQLRRTRLIQSYLGADRVLLAELCMLGPILSIFDPLHTRTDDSSLRSGRVPSTYNDPRNRGQLPLRTWRLFYEHLGVIKRAPIASRHTAWLSLDVAACFGIKQSRRLAAELFRSSRIIIRGAPHASPRSGMPCGGQRGVSRDSVIHAPAQHRRN